MTMETLESVWIEAIRIREAGEPCSLAEAIRFECRAWARTPTVEEFLAAEQAADAEEARAVERAAAALRALRPLDAGPLVRLSDEDTRRMEVLNRHPGPGKWVIPDDD